MRPAKDRTGSVSKPFPVLPLRERVVLPGLVLNLADPPQRPLTPQERDTYLREPLFWAFCWPAGRVLGAHLLAHPELVRGKTVCDLGAGSGIVALAAARAGAARVLACDIDPAARQACRHNAARNGLELVVCQEPEPCDLVLAADLLYEPANRRWLQGPCLVADCRGEPGEGFSLLGWHDSAPLPDLGFESGFRRVGLWAGENCSDRSDPPLPPPSRRIPWNQPGTG